MLTEGKENEFSIMHYFMSEIFTQENRERGKKGREQKKKGGSWRRGDIDG